MESATWALVFLTLVLAVSTVWYSYESRQSRRISEKSLNLLRDQQRKSYEAYVVAEPWKTRAALGVTNLGPAPAWSIDVRVVTRQTEKALLYYRGNAPGLAVGGTRDVKLVDTEPFDDLACDYNWSAMIEINVQTVLGEKMPAKQMLLPVHRSVYMG